MAATLFIPLTTFAGIDIREEQLQITPNLPKAWDSLAFQLEVRGTRFAMNVTHETFTITADQPVTILVNGQQVSLEAKKEATITY